MHLHDGDEIGKFIDSQLEEKQIGSFAVTAVSGTENIAKFNYLCRLARAEICRRIKFGFSVA